MKRILNLLLLLAVPALADVDTRPSAASIRHLATNTVQARLDKWDAAAGGHRDDLATAAGITNIVYNYYGELIIDLLQPILNTYTHAFTTNSILFGPDTTLVVDNLTTTNILAGRIDASHLTVTGTLYSDLAFMDFPGTAPPAVRAENAMVTRGTLHAGDTYATNAAIGELRAPSLSAETFPAYGMTSFDGGFTIHGDVYLYLDDTLSDLYSSEILRMSVTTGVVTYAYNPSFVTASAYGPQLTAGRYRAEYKSGSSVLATVGMDLTKSIPVAGLGPRGVLDSMFVPHGVSASIVSGLPDYTASVYLSALQTPPVGVDFIITNMPSSPVLPDPWSWSYTNIVTTTNLWPDIVIPPLGLWGITATVAPCLTWPWPVITNDTFSVTGPELPVSSPLWYLAAAVTPVLDPVVPPLPPSPVDPFVEPGDPARCYTPHPILQFIPDPPLVMYEITVFAPEGNGIETRAFETTTQGAWEPRDKFIGRAYRSAKRIEDAYKADTPPDPVYSRVLVPGRLLWQDFATINTGYWFLKIHHAAYMARLATSVVIMDYRQRSALGISNSDWWYLMMGYPGNSADASYGASWSFDHPPNPTSHSIGNVLHAAGNTVYWISDNPSADAYFGATTVVTLNHKTGAIELDTTYGTSLDDMALPYPLAEQMRIRDWTGEVVARRDYNPTMASSPSGLHALTGDTPYNMEVRRADSNAPNTVYGTSGMTIVADSSGNKMQDSAGGGWYMVTTTPNSDGTVDVAVHGRDGPSVPHGDITAVTATRGFNAAGQSGVWWTFHRKQVCR